jgi:catechol 2,3-dioxygenase-like lactoylglutathione lyase family enzyme
VDYKLELVTLPVADVDRAKSYYLEQAGFVLDVDFRGEGDFRVVQLTPPGSACSIALMRNEQAAGSLQALYLVVSDIELARAELARRGAKLGEIWHMAAGQQVPGPDPARGDYESFCELTDPDGNAWLLQEVGHQGPAS